MMSKTNLVHSSDCKCLSWRPIIAGALVAIGLTFLLNLFLVAMGVTAFSVNEEGTEALALMGLVATSFGIIASMFAAGWVTGYLGRTHCTKRHLGALYGFLAWCLALIVTIFLMTHVQQYISFYGHFISGRADSFQISSGVASAATTLKTLPPKTLVISTYIIFVLFFLSAFSCSLGGHCGMCYKCREENN